MQDHDHLLEENQRLKRAVEELSILNEITRAINSTMDLDQILDMIVQNCIERMNVEQAAVQLLQKPEENEQNSSPLKTMIRKVDVLSAMGPYRLNAHLTDWMIKNQKPLLSNDLVLDERFQDVPVSDLNIRSLLSVPLVLNGRMIGLINLFNKKDSSAFGADDERLLSIIASQSAQVIENARLAREEKKLMKVQEELKTAQRIQNRLQQVEIPEINGYCLSAHSVSAREVGGDLFDVSKLDDGRIVFCVADVSGKGMAAAILMACLQSTIRGQAGIDEKPSECIARVNRSMFNSTTPEKYATLFYGVLDPFTHRVTYVNAGHNRPYLLKEDGGIVTLETTGAAVGCFDHMPYQERTFEIRRGETLIIFSDGIPEAQDNQDNEYEEERLLDAVRAVRHMPSALIVDSVFANIRKFTGDTPQFDDMTLMVMKRR